ncbi:MAG: hypothetical protein AABO57_07280 [Acidobacteriota bacterium]
MSKVPGRGKVQVQIDGLIVCYYDEDRKIYQIGAVPESSHTFSVVYEIIGESHTTRTEVTSHDGGRFWRLEVEGTEPNATRYFSPSPPNRLKPPESSGSPEALDARWVIDFESVRDLPAHLRPMPLDPGVLDPIIDIMNGTVYCSSLTEPCKRVLNGGTSVPFGVANDEMSVELDAQPGESIRLMNLDTGDVIFRIPIGEESVTISLLNLPDESDSSEHSHFEMYYDAVFSDVPPEKRYSFVLSRAAAERTDAEHPHDPHHHNAAPFRRSRPGRGAPTPLCGSGDLGSHGGGLS